MMKRITLITCLLLCVLAYAQAKEKTINRPPFIGWSSTSIEVDKVVLSDTATVLYIKAFYRPENWIRIASTSFLQDNNKTKYPLRSGIGITPGKDFWMPKSGEAEFQLLFPPLKKGVTSIDFSEGDSAGGFSIWGIQLKSNTLPALVLPKEATAPLKELTALPVPQIQNDKALFTGKIIDFQAGMPNQFTIYLQGCLNLTEKAEVKVNADGTFSCEIPVITLTPAIAYTGGEALNLFLAPGEETKLFINTREISRSQSHLQKESKPCGKKAYYAGYLAALSNELADQAFVTALDQDFRHLIEEVKDKNLEEIKTYLLSKRKEKEAAIIALKASPACKQVLQLQVDFSAAYLLSFATAIVQRAYIINNNLNDEQTTRYMKSHPISMPNDYLDVLKDFSSLNTLQALYIPSYNELMNNYFQQQFAKALGTEKGSYFELSTVNRILNNMANFTPVTDEQLAQLAPFNPIYTKVVKAQNSELLAKIELNKKKTGFTINEVGEVSNEDLFASIIAKFRGKVLLVDFWATWCGPCRMANKDMVPMKEELKDKDIVYVYLTGESSPLGTWQNMITDIHGEHFRLTNAQWEYLMGAFKIDGVPTYILVDREGNIKYKTTGFPGVNTMKSKLLESSR